MDTVYLKFVEFTGRKRSQRCKLCLFCLKDNIVDSDQDNGHEDCSLEQAENGFPDDLNCWAHGREDRREGYWTI